VVAIVCLVGSAGREHGPGSTDAVGSPAAAPAATYVGGKACGACHQEEAQRWRGSHHDLAMQPATEKTVRGRFDGATFQKDGVTTTFFRRDGRYMVRTDGPDGQLHEYPVAYTFGVDPLQQYLIELPGGRYQALSIAWDARPAPAGGQRWFHLHPKEKIDHRDVLHWTGPMQNWNFMCADCHSTNLKKNYRPKEDRFETTWSDVDVSCEACHGPGSRHVQWAENTQRGHTDDDPLRGLVVRLRDTSGGEWKREPGASIAHRTAPPSSRAEIETCGRCHARRAQILDGYRPGEPLAQDYRVALLDAGLYHADGQIEDEVYEYGSFLQSKMYAAGVTCSNCHDPHSGHLRAPGNAVCAQCHQPSTFDGPQHHFHRAGTAAALCVSCHMIQRTYMVVDDRHDHSFRVPRPDLSERLGTPNACTDCHEGKTARWAAEAVVKWYGPTRPRQRPYAEALHAGRTYRADAEMQLVRTIQDAAVPAIARASALSLLPGYLGPRSLPALAPALGDGDPLVRRAAAGTLAALEPRDRVALGFPLLQDPVRTVRMEALASLLDVPRDAFTTDQRAVLDKAIQEYRRVQAFNADRAGSHVNLGMLESRLGNDTAARTEFDTALRLQPAYVPAYVALADLQRRQGREGDVETTLRRALGVAPGSADVHEALGLSLVRQERMPEALAELGRAAELQPDEPRYAYVHGVALHDTGDARQAIQVLEKTHDRAPAARDVLVALIQYEAEQGDRAAAAARARELLQSSGDERARRLLQRLEQQHDG
jgi:predicted CXXCH cytochrome family protein